MVDVTELLRKAEMQQINLQTEVQLQKNLAFFKQKQPTLYNQFSEYTPETLRLLFTEEGYLNLVNYKLNNLPVYQENPVDHARKNIQNYLQNPTDFKCNAAKTPTIDEENNAHVFNANKMADILSTQVLEKTKELPSTVNLMVMLGVGLGYQLEGLLDVTDIRHLCIIEPQPDIFYASAHAIDWQPIFQHFSQDGYSLEIIIGKDQDTYINPLNAYIKKIGPFNIINPFIFHHLTSEALKESFDNFIPRIMDTQINGLGFFDDEQVGLAHTISNTSNQIPILHAHATLNKTYLNKPAFIIANGPSLDNAAEFLQDNQDKAIIFSCGTTLAALTKMGIKPDFHIEMERFKPVVEWIKSATNEEDRKDITLLALNTVHPEVFELFEKKAMAMKANDIGSHYFTQYIKKDKQMINFGNCNPTVGNCGIAFASALGFQDVYLFGLDLGFPEGEKHHSKLSTYYNIKESAKKSIKMIKQDFSNAPSVVGNFGGKVITNGLYLTSVQQAEMAMKINKRMHCFNTSNGVLIKGADPLHVENISLKNKSFNKKKYADKIYIKYFNSHILKELKPKEMEDVFKFTIEALSSLETIAERTINTRQQGMDLLADLHTYIESIATDQNKQYAAHILRGSFSTLSIFSAQALYRTNDEQTNISLFKQCLKHLLLFIETAKKIAQSDLFTIDKRTHNLDRKLKSTIKAPKEKS